MITLNKNYIGYDKDINIKFGNEMWSFNSTYNINDLLKLYNINSIDDIRNKYKSLINTLNIKDSNIEFKSMLGDKIFKEHALSVKNSLTQLIEVCDINYLNILEKRIKFTNSFSEFTFKEKLYCKNSYDHTSSSTGRVKIIDSKINFLTMKKCERKNIESSYVNGKIIIIDIVSLEPRVLSQLIDIPHCHDVYNDIKQKLNISSSREKVKLGLIATIYGGSSQTIKKISGLTISEIESIRSYFKINELRERLNNEEKVFNFYGRPLNKSSAIVNHYIQSTSADCALLAFNNFMQELVSKKIKFIAFIHDAIIIDVHPSALEDILKLKNIKEDILNIKLPVTVEVLWKRKSLKKKWEEEIE